MADGTLATASTILNNPHDESVARAPSSKRGHAPTDRGPFQKRAKRTKRTKRTDSRKKNTVVVKDNGDMVSSEHDQNDKTDVTDDDSISHTMSNGEYEPNSIQPTIFERNDKPEGTTSDGGPSGTCTATKEKCADPSEKGGNELPPGNPSISCLLYTSPSPRDQRGSRMPSSA